MKRLAERAASKREDASPRESKSSSSSREWRPAPKDALIPGARVWVSNLCASCCEPQPCMLVEAEASAADHAAKCDDIRETSWGRRRRTRRDERGERAVPIDFPPADGPSPESDTPNNPYFCCTQPVTASSERTRFDEFSVSFWVKQTSRNCGGCIVSKAQPVALQSPSGTSPLGWQILLDGGSEFSCEFSSIVFSVTVSTPGRKGTIKQNKQAFSISARIHLGVWHHVVATFSSSDSRTNLFIDGGAAIKTGLPQSLVMDVLEDKSSSSSSSSSSAAAAAHQQQQQQEIRPREF